MQLQIFIPAGFGSGLHEPEPVFGVNTEFRIHDNAAVSLAHGAHAFSHAFGLAQREGPAQGFQLRDFLFSGAAALVVNDAHVLAAHLTDDHFAAVVTLKDVELVRRDLTAHHSFAQAVTGVYADQILAVRAAAARGRVGGKGRAGNDGVDHLHHADGKRSVLNGPFFLGRGGDGFVARFFGFGQSVKDGLAPVGHGAQIIGRGAVPVVGFHHFVLTHHIQIRVLQAGEGLFAGVFARR